MQERRIVLAALRFVPGNGEVRRGEKKRVLAGIAALRSIAASLTRLVVLARAFKGNLEQRNKSEIHTEENEGPRTAETRCLISSMFSRGHLSHRHTKKQERYFHNPDLTFQEGLFVFLFIRKRRRSTIVDHQNALAKLSDD